MPSLIFSITPGPCAFTSSPLWLPATYCGESSRRCDRPCHHGFCSYRLSADAGREAVRTSFCRVAATEYRCGSMSHSLHLNKRTHLILADSNSVAGSSPPCTRLCIAIPFAQPRSRYCSLLTDKPLDMTGKQNSGGKNKPEEPKGIQTRSQLAGLQVRLSHSVPASPLPLGSADR